MEISLAGQVAIVTGGSSGIGSACVEALAEAGAAVGVNYHSNRESAETLVHAINSAGGRAIVLSGNVADPEDVDRMLKATVEAFGGLDIMIANAGIQKDASLVEMSVADWRQVIDTNLTGQFLCAQAAIRQFLRQPPRGVSRARGKVLCMSSVHEVIPWAGHVNYAASKGGIMMMTKTMAQEVASQGIRVNALAPGAIRTPINSKETEGEKGEQLLKLIPYGRIGEAKDIGQAAAWIVSDLADYIVGTTLFIDGGMTLYPEFRGNG